MRSRPTSEQEQRRHGRDLGTSTDRNELKTTTGHGDAPAALTNDEMIVSSRLKLNASSAPASTAGSISRSVNSAGSGAPAGRRDRRPLPPATPPTLPNGRARSASPRRSRTTNGQPTAEHPLADRGIVRSGPNGPPIRTYQIGARSRRLSRASPGSGTRAGGRVLSTSLCRAPARSRRTCHRIVAITAVPAAAGEVTS